MNLVSAPTKPANPEVATVCEKCGAQIVETETTCVHCGSPRSIFDVQTVNSADGAVTEGVATPFPHTTSASSAMTADNVIQAQTQSSLSQTSSPEVDFGPRYRVEKVLGEGGMGIVYKAWDKELERTVALKLIRRDLTRDPEISQRFKQELLLASKVSHRNVLRIHDLGDGPGDTKFISMAFVEGQDLGQLLKKDGKLPAERALNIAHQLCAGLDAAHSEGVVHRDLKPQNIMIDQHDHVYVTDFGLAKSLESDLSMTQTGQFLGTPRYMSPEQAEVKPVDQRSDLYSFGLILCEMLTGRLPFERTHSTMQMMYQRVHEPAKNPRTLSHEMPAFVSRIIEKCLERDVSLRYQSATEILADLDAGRPPKAVHHRWIRTSASSASRRLWIPAFIVVVLALGSVALRQSGIRFTSGTSAGPQVSLAILPFRNASGDASLDWLGSSLAEVLSTDVGQSTQLRTVSPNRLHQLFSDLKISTTAVLDQPTIRRVAEFTSADRVVSGQYAKFGEQIRIDATIQDLRRGRTTTLAESASERDILSAIDRLASDIRSNLALSRSVIQELQGQAFKPSTSSVSALRDYNQGLQLARSGKSLDAARRFEAATAEDPRFALAYSELAKTYANLGQDDQAGHAAQKAVELSEGLPPQEKYLIQASYEGIRRDYPKAIEAYENLVRAVPGDADVLFELGGLYERASAYGKARDEYTTVLSLDPKRVDAMLALGRVEVYSGNSERALEYLMRAQALTVEAGNDEERAQILQAMGVAYADLNKHEDAISDFHDSLEIKRKLGLQKGMAMSLDAMASSEKVLGRLDEALKHYNEALGLWQSIGDKAGLGDVLNDLAQFYVDRGLYDQALKLFKESLQAQVDVGNQNNEALVLNNIGNAYFFKADYQNARTYFERALQVREQLKVPSDIADSLHNLADTCTKMAQYDLATSQYLRALDLRRAAGDKRGAAIESSSLGILFSYQGRYGAALGSEEDALKSFRELQDRTYWLAEILGLYGSTLAQQGRYQEAQKGLDEAMRAAQELKNPETTSEIQGYQGDNAFYAGDYKSAAGLYNGALQLASHTSNLDLILIAKLNVAKVAVRQGHLQSAATSLSSLLKEADSMGRRYVSVECLIYHAEALMNLKRYESARRELETALNKSSDLGLRALLARSQYLLARDLELAGRTADAPEHYQQARKILDEIKKEANTESIVTRSDLSPIFAHPTN